MTRAQKARKLLLDGVFIIAGGMMMAVSVNIFLKPHDVVPGGATGLAMILNKLFPALPIGVLIILINLPLFALSWWLIGHKFILSTVFGTVVSSVIIDLSANLFVLEAEPLLAAVYGGLFMGAGLGLVFMRGATTGGGDIAVRLIQLKFRHLQSGRVYFMIDLVVVLLAGITFRSINGALYAIVTIYVSSITMDGLLYGMNVARMAYIVTEKSEEIAQMIMRDMELGVTFLRGEGGYRGEDKRIIMCVARRQQLAAIKQKVIEVDPRSFVIVTQANEVLGEGFIEPGKNT